VSELTRVLAVEDDPDIREVLELALETVGDLTVSLHGDVPSGLAALPHFKPDLILLDVMLPGISGPEALPLIRAMDDGKHAVIVFLTAKARSENNASYLALGAQEVMLKPFDPLTLADTLRQVFDAKRADVGR
jgi:two-component system, OmpR family, response regulator